MNLRSLKIGIRLKLGFTIVLLILLSTLLLSNILNSKGKEQVINDLMMNSQKTELAHQMKTALLESNIAMLKIGIQAELADMQKEGDIYKKEQKNYNGFKLKLSNFGLNSNEKTIVTAIDVLNKKVEGPLGKALGQSLAFNGEAAIAIINKEITPINIEALKQIDKLIVIQEEESKKAINNSKSNDIKINIVLMSIALLALTISAIFAILITNSIIKPLKESVMISKKVSLGDLTTKVILTGKDEISELLHSLKEMTENLYKIVSEVRVSTDNINTSSNEIATGNMDLSSRTESQAGSLEETASAMEELTSTVQQNADNAKEANQLVMNATDIANKGGEVVSQVVLTMGEIKESSKQIMDIIGVIDSISFQTNILALNAAVEAAHAGEQGRGFAVVASEVRNLAQRSASAAKEIKTLIALSNEKVNNGSTLVNNAGKTMEEIVSSVKSVAKIMGEITNASQEQSVGIKEINQAITKMDEMTQQNAALVEEAAAAAQSMTEQAKNLSTSVTIFKLE